LALPLPASVALIACIGFSAELSRADEFLEKLTNGLPPFISERELKRTEVQFGQFLFQSRLLSRDNAVACVDCHKPELAFSDGLRVPEVRGAEVGRRNTPSISNLYYTRELMWDGGAIGLQAQVIFPLTSEYELNIDWNEALNRIAMTPEARRFVGSANPTITRTAVVGALSAYVGSLVTSASIFDKYFYGKMDGAISREAIRGLRLFEGKARCSSCHSVSGDFALFTDNRFHSVGVGFDGSKYADTGRYAVTQDAADLGRFKTPSLRNVSRTAPYMHDGSMKTLQEVLEYYNRGGNRDAPNLDEKIQPLGLSDNEIAALLAFLDTLNSNIMIFSPSR
jgi:cytochrome c peroxidase